MVYEVNIDGKQIFFEGKDLMMLYIKENGYNQDGLPKCIRVNKVYYSQNGNELKKVILYTNKIIT